MKAGGENEIETFEDGDIIVQEGDHGRDMYVIHSGEVEVVREVGGNTMTLAVLERGAFFGEMSLLEGLPRSATVRARGKTKLLILRPGSLLLKIRRDPSFAFEMLQQMSRRIRELNERLVYGLASGTSPGRQTRSLLTLSATSEYRSIDPEPEEPSS